MAETAKAFQIVGLVLVVGAPAFWLLFWQRLAGRDSTIATAGATLRCRLRAAAAAGAGLALVGAGLDVWRGLAPWIGEVPMTDALELAASFLANTRLGQSRGLTIIAAAIAATFAVWILRPGEPSPPSGGLAVASQALAATAVVLGGAAVWASHASTGSAAAGAIIADAAHLAAVVAWGSVLIGLAAVDWVALEGASSQPHQPVIDLLAQTSITALVSVLVLLAAGLWLAFAHALGLSPSLSALRVAQTADYGHLIVIKAGLLLAALVPAALNRFVVIRRLKAAAQTQAVLRSHMLPRFGWLVRVETGVFLLLIAAAAALTQTAPPEITR